MNTMITNEKGLSVDEVCRIITVCQKQGVKHLQFNGLIMDLESYETPLKVRRSITKNNELMDHDEPVDRMKQEYKIKSEQLEELLITDPVQYERLMQQGEIIDAKPDNR